MFTQDWDQSLPLGYWLVLGFILLPFLTKNAWHKLGYDDTH